MPVKIYKPEHHEWLASFIPGHTCIHKDQLVSALDQICEIRNYYIHTEHLIFRECKAAIYNQYFVIAFDKS